MGHSRRTRSSFAMGKDGAMGLVETDLLSHSLASVDLDASAIGTREKGANVEREGEIALLGHFNFPCFVPSPCHAAVTVGDALLHFATLCTSVTTLHFRLNTLHLCDKYTWLHLRHTCYMLSHCSTNSTVLQGS